MDPHPRLAELGLTLPDPPSPVASYVPAVRTGHLVFVSGQLPMRDGEMTARGVVPSVVSIDDAGAAARQCALNALAVLGGVLEGDWSRLARIVRLGVFVASDSGFTDQARVANGASDLMTALFDEAGRHARAAVGVNALPLGATVELEMLAELR